MTIVDRLVGHDAWTTRQLLLRCRELTDEQMERTFDIGDRSLLETFEHLITCMEMHTDLLLEREDADPRREDESIDGLLNRLQVVSIEFGAFASRVDLEGSADATCTNLRSGKKLPFGSVIAHILTHGMHHRAQIMYMLEQLGVPEVMEGDALGWEGQARGWGYRWCNSYGRVVTD